MTAISIRATYMRGGTSKGTFFVASDLPLAGPARDALLLRLTGSPDPYRKQIDGMGGATSSTSKVVVLDRSQRPDCDVDFWFGQVSIDQPLIDWSGNCGNLSAAVGPFALWRGLVAPQRVPRDGVAEVRIWQANLGQRIVAQVPMRDGEPLESGEFHEDGVSFSGAPIPLAFYEDCVAGPPLCPTGRPVDALDVPGVGMIEATLVTAGNPTVFVRAADLGLTGCELPVQIDGNAALQQTLEAIRAAGSVAMGLAKDAHSATHDRPATPKIAWVAPPADYVNSAGTMIEGSRIDVLGRIMSMGRAHHAFTGTGSIALAAAAALPGSLVRAVSRHGDSDEPADSRSEAHVRLGHVSGILPVGAAVVRHNGVWRMEQATLTRSARRLMTGEVHLPAPL